jgi:hypothetical protein
MFRDNKATEAEMTNKNQNPQLTGAFWPCAIITAMSALVSASYSIAALLGGGKGDLFAMYASRSISLLLVVPVTIWFRSRFGLAVIALTMALVQLFDTVVGVHIHDAGKTYGPLAFALATFASIAALLRQPESSSNPLH